MNIRCYLKSINLNVILFRTLKFLNCARKIWVGSRQPDQQCTLKGPQVYYIYLSDPISLSMSHGSLLRTRALVSEPTKWVNCPWGLLSWPKPEY